MITYRNQSKPDHFRDFINRFRETRMEKQNDEAVKKYALDNMPQPCEIEIETINRCNGICPFCPINANEPQRPYKVMTEELFKKIIDELAMWNYSGKVGLYSNNEPFLDSRIPEWQKYAKEKVPNAYWHLYTNGTLLTVELLEKMLPNIDEILIDNYNDDGAMNPPVEKISEYLNQHKDVSSKVNICMRKQTEILNSRGGQAPNKKNKAKCSKARCVLPFQQMIIRPDGKLSLCCADALGKYTLGDVNTASLQQIWCSESYRKIRETMRNQGRKALNLCNRCDVVGGKLDIE